MEQFSALIAASRREDYLREAANERLVRQARRERRRDQHTEPVRRRREAARPAIA